MAETMTYKKLVDYVVGVLYKLRTERRQSGFYSLKAIVNELHPTGFDEVKEIAKYLEAQGFVKSWYVLGDVLVELSTRGVIYFEDKDTGFKLDFDSFIGELEKKGFIDATASKSSSDVVTSSKNDLVREIEEFKRSVEASNATGRFNDYLHDIDVLLSELKKDAPDKEILAHKSFALLENMSFRPMVSGIVSKLGID